MRIRLSLLAALLILCALLLGGCGGSATGKGTLRVCVRAEINNFGYLNPETGRYSGLEIDLADAIARELGYAGTELVTAQPEQREELLLSGEVDCVVACFTISDERREHFDFSAPYYSDGVRIMVERSARVQEPRQLEGGTVGVLSGSNAAQLFEQALPGLFVHFEEMDHYSELSAALERGDVDALCMDGCIAQAYMDEDRLLLDEVISAQDYGVATVKGSPLSSGIAGAVNSLLASGEVARIIDKWN